MPKSTSPQIVSHRAGYGNGAFKTRPNPPEEMHIENHIGLKFSIADAHFADRALLYEVDSSEEKRLR